MKKPNRLLWLYLAFVALLWGFCFLTLHLWLAPYSVAHAETGKLSVGYLLYALIGIVFSTPTPFLSTLTVAVGFEKIHLRDFFARMFYTEKKGRTIFLTAFFCLYALVFALWRGTPNGSPPYLFLLGFCVMLPFVGFAEEAGWRGLLQPLLESKLPYPFSVLVTAAIWYVWHLDLWIDPTSNHYGDSLVGFGITIFLWAFALAALYKATKSVFACAVYHTFVDSLGAVYDWNALFDAFPGSVGLNLYRLGWLAFSVTLWIVADCSEKREKGKMRLASGASVFFLNEKG